MNEGLLNSDYSLAEARVLYELANRDAPKASEIAEGLGMDPGYLSRLLGKFERDGLLQKKVSEQDGRFAELVLTTRGKSVFKKLNELSNEQAHAALQGLPPAARTEVIHCMQSIEDLLMKTDRSRTPYVLRPHRVGDMGWIVYREGLGYAEQYGWDATFEALVADIVCRLHHSLRAGPGTVLDRRSGWPARRPRVSGQASESSAHGEASPAVCRAKRPGYGPGPCVGKRVRPVRSHCGLSEDRSMDAEHVDCGASHLPGCGLRLVKEEPHHSFGHDLVGQEWELDLT